MTSLLSLYLALAALPANGALASEGTLSWTTDNAGKTVDEDISLVRVEIGATRIPLGSAPDACVAISRQAAPAYPDMTAGYSELLCWHAERFASEQGWRSVIHLRDTPLYIPKGTTIACRSGAQAQDSGFYCRIRYTSYVRGMARYRMLRLPYLDQGPNDDGSLAVSYYIGAERAPLHVRGVQMFQSFGGDATNGTLTNACLRWLHQGGAVVQQACFPTQAISTNADYDSPRFMRVDWTIPAPDLLNATAQQSRNNTDAAFYAIAEIPPDIPADPENVVRDYDNVPSNYLPDYCAEYLNVLRNQPYTGFLCGKDRCDDATLVSACTHMFPKATWIPPDLVAVGQGN
ncbi:MAG: hypothetical protein NTX64_02840 [Elusimicrobia bacterium]|nr:hypothetical protein [Elusimicrobiota bacterium]